MTAKTKNRQAKSRHGHQPTAKAPSLSARSLRAHGFMTISPEGRTIEPTLSIDELVAISGLPRPYALNVANSNLIEGLVATGKTGGAFRARSVALPFMLLADEVASLITARKLNLRGADSVLNQIEPHVEPLWRDAIRGRLGKVSVTLTHPETQAPLATLELKFLSAAQERWQSWEAAQPQ